MRNSKKLMSLLLALVLLLGLAACGGGEEKRVQTDKAKELGIDDTSLYLITDEGTIDDKSFNQGSFEGLDQYAKELGVKANYLKPAEKSNQVYKQTIDQAVEKGAKIVVTPGFYFENPVWQAQKQYPNVKFIAVDFEPREAEGKPSEIGANTSSITFREEQSGFLAGYAVVKDGFTKLGFMGGYPVPAVVRFGYGFLAGANVAAEEMGVDVSVKFNYTNSFEAKPEINTMAASWYKDGTEVIFSCGGGIAASVAKAADENKGMMVGVDVDQKDLSKSVITSAMKNLQKSVYDTAKTIMEGKFDGGEAAVESGKSAVLSVNEKGVQISDDFSRFKNFKKADYDAIYEKLVKNEGGLTDKVLTQKDPSDTDPSAYKDQITKVKLEYIK